MSTSLREANSSSPQDTYQLNDGQSQRKAGPMLPWKLKRKVDPVMIVDGRGNLTTSLFIQNAPSWRPLSVALVPPCLDFSVGRSGMLPLHRDSFGCPNSPVEYQLI